MTDTFRQGERLTAAKLNNLLARPVSITQVTGLEDTLDLKASVEALNAAVAALEAQIDERGTGSVTSVQASGGTTGFAFSGGPVTTSGTLTLTVSDAPMARTAIGAAAVSHPHAASDVSGRPVVVGPSISGVMTNAEKLATWVAPAACSFPAGAAGSYAKAGTAATGSATVTAYKNGVSFATFVWSASGTSATVTIISATSFAAGDVLTFVGPATADTTLADVGITLAGTWA